MKATEAPLLAFLADKKQFLIPIYQRAYAWTLEHCERLWDDIVRTGRDAGAVSHFIGAIVYVHEGAYSATMIPKMLVIDGQQRITTITLLIRALSDAAAARPNEIEQTPDLFRDYYLFNTHMRDERRYKLLLTRRDRDTLLNLLDGTPLPTDASPRVLENHRFFVEHMSNVDLEIIMTGLSKLLIIDVSLEVGRDNPQLIFESLNSTGLDLSQSDLVRNWVLMGEPVDVQDRLFTAYWYPMESLFNDVTTVAFDDFLRDFLTFETRAIPRKDRVYDAFKAWVATRSEGLEEIVSMLHDRAQLYARMRLGREPRPDLRRRFDDLRELEVDTSYPFLLGVYRDVERGVIDVDAFATVLDMVESYVFRRAVCDIPTNTLNRTFATLHGMIDQHDYIQSLASQLYRMGGTRVFPDDATFIGALARRNVYLFRRSNYLLRKLENHGRKEPVDVRQFSIEHVMPQNPDLPQWWREEIGTEWEDVHETRLHTLGNLTLTGYNSELSDRPFAEKQSTAGGFRDSPLRLNRTLAQLTRWNAEAMDRRGRELAVEAARIWPFLPLPPEVLEQFRRFRQAGQPDDATTERREQGYALATLFLDRVRQSMPDVLIEERKLVRHLYGPGAARIGSVVTWQGGMTLTLNVDLGDLRDPLGLCKAKDRGTWGYGKVYALLRTPQHIDYGITLLAQAMGQKA